MISLDIVSAYWFDWYAELVLPLVFMAITGLQIVVLMLVFDRYRKR